MKKMLVLMVACALAGWGCVAFAADEVTSADVDGLVQSLLDRVHAEGEITRVEVVELVSQAMSQTFTPEGLRFRLPTPPSYSRIALVPRDLEFSHRVEDLAEGLVMQEFRSKTAQSAIPNPQSGLPNR
ncbi:MAG: acid shock protein [Candidatus Omnitrophica bacterium]|nr:acid shock protein [Candidatus Omnitrophota bacterium]